MSRSRSRSRSGSRSRSSRVGETKVPHTVPPSDYGIGKKRPSPNDREQLIFGLFFGSWDLKGKGVNWFGGQKTLVGQVFDVYRPFYTLRKSF